MELQVVPSNQSRTRKCTHVRTSVSTHVATYVCRYIHNYIIHNIVYGDAVLYSTSHTYVHMVLKYGS